MVHHSMTHLSVEQLNVSHKQWSKTKQFIVICSHRDNLFSFRHIMSFHISYLRFWTLFRSSRCIHFRAGISSLRFQIASCCFWSTWSRPLNLSVLIFFSHYHAVYKTLSSETADLELLNAYRTLYWSISWDLSWMMLWLSANFLSLLILSGTE